MTLLFPLNTFARAVVDRFLNLRVICFGHNRCIDILAVIVRFSKVVAVEPEVLRVCVSTEATARAIIFNYVNDSAHAVNLCK